MALLKLSPLDREIIPRVQLDAKRSPSTIARELKVQERSVRHRLSKLTESRSLIRAPFFNVHPLGYRYVNLYFSSSTVHSASIDQFLRVLAREPRVAWLAELGAEYQFGMSLLVQEVEEVKEFLDRVSQQFPDIFFEKNFVFHLALTVFPAKFLAGKRFQFVPLSYGRGQGEVVIDELDRKILVAMGDKLLISGRAVARAIGAPHSTVEVRMRKLEQHGVIAGYWSLFDVTKIGYQTFKLLLHAKGHQHALAGELSQFAHDHPNISYFIECLGNWDFELGLDVEEAAHVSHHCRALLTAFGAHLNSIRVVPMFRVLKWSPVGHLGRARESAPR